MASLTDALVKQLRAGRYIASLATKRAVTYCYTSLESMNMRSCAWLETIDGA
jgi:hypothetical protein